MAHLPVNLRLLLLYHGCLILQAELRLWDGGEKVLSETFSHDGQNGLPGASLLVLEEEYGERVQGRNLSIINRIFPFPEASMHHCHRFRQELSVDAKTSLLVNKLFT